VTSKLRNGLSAAFLRPARAHCGEQKSPHKQGALRRPVD
jgi:hypothetical protein